MIRILKWLVAPALLVAAMAFAGANRAEARWYGYRIGPRPYAVYRAPVVVAPRAYYGPRVYVAPPAVRVYSPGIVVPGPVLPPPPPPFFW